MPPFLKGEMGYGFACGLIVGGVIFVMLLSFMGYTCVR